MAHHRMNDSLFFVKKQALVAGAGFLLIAAIQVIPFKWIERITLPLFLVSIIGLILTLVPGFSREVNGASRWLKLGPVALQPAELVKLTFIMFLAKNLARPHYNTMSLRSILPNLIVFSLLALPMMLQPDFGSTFLLFLVCFCMLYGSGMPLKFSIWGIVLAILGVVLAIIQAPYRMARLMTFLDPWKDLHKGGFQIIQSYLGFQNGGLLGVGIGDSRQKLFFLPEAHTDFIIAVIGEEFGLLGVSFVILCFCLLVTIGMSIAGKQRLIYRKFLGFGLTFLIAAQACINMGVATGLLPTKGIPLPFVSSGASSLIIFLIVIGLLSRLDQSVGTNNHVKKTN